MDEHGFLRPGILRTNYAPSLEERQVIRETIIPLHLEASRKLDAQVENLKKTLEALKCEQQARHQLLEAHSALLSPMRRLIPDVLLEIFRHCHINHYEVPLRLARVCRRWRELVLSTPTLWCVVMLHDTMSTRNIVPFVRACIQYSGNSPLKIVVKFLRRRPDTGLMKRALFEALGILAGQVHRWKSIEIFLDGIYKSKWEIKLPGFAPLLEKITLVVDPGNSSRLQTFDFPLYQPSDIPLLLQSNKLRFLYFGGSTGQLTLMDCWSILSNCPEIERFEMSSMRQHSGGAPVPKEVIHLSNLRDLRLGPYIPDPGPLIRCIKAPALQRMSLLVSSDANFESSCFSRLVQECRPPLENLMLGNIDGEDVASCIPLLSRLTSLSLQQGSASDLVIARLMKKDDEGRFYCPTLSHLSLRLCLFTGRNLVDMARERRQAAGGLQVVVDKKGCTEKGLFSGLTIELSLVGEFSDAELKELYDLQT